MYLSRRTVFSMSAAGACVALAPKRSHAFFEPVAFAIAALAFVVIGLVRDERLRQGWRDRYSKKGNWLSTHRDVRAETIATYENYVSVLKGQEGMLEREWWRRPISASHSALDVHQLFPPSSRMVMDCSSNTAVNSTLAAQASDVVHYHPWRREVPRDLNDAEEVAIGKYFIENRIAPAPITRRRMPLVLRGDRDAFDDLLTRSNRDLSDKAVPAYSRDFVTQARHVVTGFAVPTDQLTPGAFDRIVDGFDSAERSLVRTRMLYAMFFA